MKKQFMKQYGMVKGCQQGNKKEEEEENREEDRTSLAVTLVSMAILCKQFGAPTFCLYDTK